MPTGPIGTVISNQETPSTSEFSFVLLPNSDSSSTSISNSSSNSAVSSSNPTSSNSTVTQGQLVQLSTPHGTLIASVQALMRQNRYYEFAESISQYSKESDKSFASSFPARDWEYVVAVCRILGVFTNGVIRRCSFPPSPGDEVTAADNEIVKAALGVTENGLHVGELLATSMPAQLDLSRLMQKHLAVLGMSGSGKSHLVAVIVEELLSRRPEEGRLAVVAIDPHGDYASFSSPQSPFAASTSLIEGEKIQISTTHLTPSFLSELVPSLSAPARREYSKLFTRMRNEAADQGKPLSLEDIISACEASASDRTNLADFLNEVKELKLFGLFDYPSITQEVKPGKLVIFDLSSLSSTKVKQAIVAFFGRRLFNLRREGKVAPFALVVEEAHAFAREKAQKENAISKPVIETIAREGRKFGACLCLVSQRPVQLSTTALSQCSTFIVMRVTNPYDLDHIGESCEGIDKHSLDAITTLRTGEGIIIGEATNFPAFIRVRKRLTSSTSGKSLEEIARQFETVTPVLKQTDVDAFL